MLSDLIGYLWYKPFKKVVPTGIKVTFYSNISGIEATEFKSRILFRIVVQHRSPYSLTAIVGGKWF